MPGVRGTEFFFSCGNSCPWTKAGKNYKNGGRTLRSNIFFFKYSDVLHFSINFTCISFTVKKKVSCIFSPGRSNQLCWLVEIFSAIDTLSRLLWLSERINGSQCCHSSANTPQKAIGTANQLQRHAFRESRYNFYFAALLADMPVSWKPK